VNWGLSHTHTHTLFVFDPQCLSTATYSLSPFHSLSLYLSLSLSHTYYLTITTPSCHYSLNDREPLTHHAMSQKLILWPWVSSVICVIRTRHPVSLFVYPCVCVCLVFLPASLSNPEDSGVLNNVNIINVSASTCYFSVEVCVFIQCHYGKERIRQFIPSN
jgi:hypothetical protein